MSLLYWSDFFWSLQTESAKNSRVSALEEYKDLIIGLLEKEMSGVRIHEELRKEGAQNKLRKCSSVCREHQKKKQCLRKISYRGRRGGASRFWVCGIAAEERW